jgi:hypothetical protein
VTDRSALMLHMWRVQGSSLCPYTAMLTVYRCSVQSLLVQSRHFLKLGHDQYISRPFECTIFFFLSFPVLPSLSTHCRCGELLLQRNTHTHTHTHTHTVRLLWTRNRSVAETSSQQNTTRTRDRHPCSLRHSNAQSQ